MDLVAPLGIRLLFVLSFAAMCVAMARLWLRYGHASVGVPEVDNATSRLDVAYPSDPIELGFLALISTVLICGGVGVLLAVLGWFSLLGLSLALLPPAVVVIRRFRTPRHTRVASLTRSTLALGALLFVAALVYARPHEYVLGGSDAGSYVNLSAVLARTGDFVVRDPWQSLLVEHADVMLREQPAGWQTRYLQFVGWYIGDQDATRLIPQFFPLHPILLAVGTALAGLKGGLYVTPLWGLLDVVIVYLITRRLFTTRTALAAATLFAVTPLQIWFSRYPTTEPLTLLLVFTGLWAAQVLWDYRGTDEDRNGGQVQWGVLGGASLGLAFLTRIDLPVVWALVIAFLVLRWLRREWHAGFSAFTVTFSVLTVCAILSAVFVNGPYTWNTYQGVWQVLQAHITWLAIPGAVVLGGGLIGGIWLYRNPKRFRNLNLAQWHVPRWARLVAGAGIVLLSLYAYVVRPRLTPIGYIQSWPTEVRVPILNGENWVRVGWYLTPLGILLATLGAAVLLYRASLYRIGLFLAVGLLTTVQYVYNVFNMPYHIYVMRRYVPIVLPVLMIFAAVAIEAVQRLRPRKVFRVAGSALLLALSAGLLYQSRFVLPQRDFHGLTDQLVALNEQLEDDAVVIIAGTSQSAVPDYFGVPLRFAFDHRVATIRVDDDGVAPALESVLDYAAVHDLPVQLLAADPIPSRLRQSLALEPVTMIPMTFSVLESTYFTYPAEIQPAYYGLDLYNVVSLASVHDPEHPYNIDIGGVDTQHILAGFHGKERLGDGTTVRWTTEEAVITLPSFDNAIEIELRAMGVAPTGVNLPNPIVYLNTVRLGIFRPENNLWQTFAFEVEADAVRDGAELRIETETFNPAQLGMSADDRDLGILLDWIIIESMSQDAK